MEGLNIILIGMMGCGKTTVLNELCSISSKIPVDTDTLIEETQGLSIPDIFEIKGEEGFREIEARLVEVVSNRRNQVISTGGGVVKSNANINNLKKNGKIVYLRCSAGNLAKRLMDEAQGRPLIADFATSMEALEGRINELLDQRSDIYMKAADLVVDVDCKTPREISKEILKKLNG